MTQEQALGVAVDRWGRGACASLDKSIGYLDSEVYSIGVFVDNITISHHGCGDSWEEALANVKECE